MTKNAVYFIVITSWLQSLDFVLCDITSNPIYNNSATKNAIKIM